RPRMPTGGGFARRPTPPGPWGAAGATALRSPGRTPPPGRRNRADPGWQRPALPALERVQAGVRRDPVQPGADRGPLGVVGGVRAARSPHGRLHEVRRVV